MYSSYVSTLSKIKLLLAFLKNGCNAKNLLTGLTYLSVVIVVLTLAKPMLRFVKNMLSKLFGKKNDKDSSDRKYGKINSLSDSCSGCKSARSESSDSDSLSLKHKQKNKKEKKCKVKMSKKKVEKALREFKLE